MKKHLPAITIDHRLHNFCVRITENSRQSPTINQDAVASLFSWCISTPVGKDTSEKTHTRDELLFLTRVREIMQNLLFRLLSAKAF